MFTQKEEKKRLSPEELLSLFRQTSGVPTALGEEVVKTVEALMLKKHAHLLWLQEYEMVRSWILHHFQQRDLCRLQLIPISEGIGESSCVMEISEHVAIASDEWLNLPVIHSNIVEKQWMIGFFQHIHLNVVHQAEFMNLGCASMMQAVARYAQPKTSVHAHFRFQGSGYIESTAYHTLEALKRDIVLTSLNIKGDESNQELIKASFRHVFNNSAVRHMSIT